MICFLEHDKEIICFWSMSTLIHFAHKYNKVFFIERGKGRAYAILILYFFSKPLS